MPRAEARSRRGGPAGRRWRAALTVRITALFLLFALLATFVFLAGMQAALRGGWQDYLRPLATHYTDLLVAQIGTPPDVARAEQLTRLLPLRIRIEGPVVNWRSHPDSDHDLAPRERLWKRQENATPDETHPRGRAQAGDSTRERWRPVRVLADGHRIAFGLADLEPEQRSRRIGWWTLAALLGVLAGLYTVVRWLLRPLRDIRAGALRYGQGDFSRPIASPRRDELGELAAQIDAMAARLKGMLDAKRALLLAISHELRSPLTRARLHAELVAEGPPRDALLHDLAQMRDLITDLLESERLADGHAALRREPSDLNALVREAAAAHAGGHAVQLELAELPMVPLDRMRIALLLRNLVDNALRHGAGGAGLVLRTGRDADGVWMSVRDHGPGVSGEHLARLGEPFYRPDEARERRTGGVGLGLTLARMVAQAHGGTLSLRPAQPGLEVLVRLPQEAG